ncbi:potassium large conductance calcium-activated channel, subfamily M beta member 3 (predicted) [Rattus norvegicus]|uniref:Calcium-activated potassium channel subunit beta n=1 Tax=Rattus norvegicus TaxID=10116 RepID=A6IHN8_RAT|nr:potassium large conductance calcium-activated channel, subfamily M beta member 3 (predicted) [Rattus norvegicus]
MIGWTLPSPVRVAARARGHTLACRCSSTLATRDRKCFSITMRRPSGPTPKCFYTPKCHGDRDHLLNSALDIKEFFDHNNGTFPCFYSPDGPLGVVLRKSGHKVVFHCLFWPLLTLLGGALIVGLVRLTQHLSFQCEKYRAVVRA